MVPASLRHPGAASPARENRTEVAARRWRPANVSFAAQAQVRAWVVWSCLLGALGIVTLLGYVWIRLKVVEAGYRLSATRQLVERLEVERMELEVRVAAADNPARLAKMASSRLQMHRPGRGEEANLPR